VISQIGKPFDTVSEKRNLPQSPSVQVPLVEPFHRPSFFAISSRSGEVVKDNTASNCYCNKAWA